VELRLQQLGDFYEKPHFTMKNIKSWAAVINCQYLSTSLFPWMV